MTTPLPASIPDGRACVSAVVWDMDGTLIDSASVVPDSFCQTVEELGGRTRSRAEIVALYSLGPPRAMLSELLNRPCSDADVDLYHDILARRATAVSACDGIKAVLDQLQATVPMAVFTGASRQAAEILLSAAGLLGYFAVLVAGDQVANPKPDPQGILKACSLVPAEPRRSIYVGDAPTDLEAARRAGAVGAAAGWGHLYDPSALADLHLRRPADLLTHLSPANSEGSA
ncbi:HAD family hydrolase [Streptomyces coacervatus]|uniref:HAD family hydrolase n=1 Tax=Streptomyces coacervatus TaxID=647381 RepID=A0ABP7HKP3_9ACTN|nr:HAD-IA family hydrolase [Streptomyces coacervatus]MDF2272059.1 HAD-IA family hydrolase [Streptomyces coacervatus]